MCMNTVKQILPYLMDISTIEKKISLLRSDSFRKLDYNMIRVLSIKLPI